jgi:NAD(P)H-hydrate epimerase
MMENAGANLAWLASGMLGGEVSGRRITVLAGPGGNGGGGLVAARRLIGWGAEGPCAWPRNRPISLRCPSSSSAY